MSELINLKSTKELKNKLRTEKGNRRTISFYKYHKIENPQKFRDMLFRNLTELKVFGRIYIAQEGINAQVSVPENDLQAFIEYLSTFDFLSGIRLNIALEDDGKSFWKLIIRVRNKVVADGIEDENFSVENKGEIFKCGGF